MSETEGESQEARTIAIIAVVTTNDLLGIASAKIGRNFGAYINDIVDANATGDTMVVSTITPKATLRGVKRELSTTIVFVPESDLVLKKLISEIVLASAFTYVGGAPVSDIRVTAWRHNENDAEEPDLIFQTGL